MCNTTSYEPYDSAVNGFFNNQFAKVNLACDQSVTLRATLLHSCSTAPSCRRCFETGLEGEERIRCFASGCDCYGQTVENEYDCTSVRVPLNKANYNCDEMMDVLVLPEEAMASMTVYDLDTDVVGETIEQVSSPAAPVTFSRSRSRSFRTFNSTD